MYPPISDYAMLSNCRVAAIVSRCGSIDWLCLPEPDGPAIFAALLDQEEGGRWQVSPDQIRSIDRTYVDGTSILETTFRCASGVMRLTDALQMGASDTSPTELSPDHELTRKIECLEGEVRVHSTFRPRPRFRRSHPHFRHCGQFGLIVDAGEHSCVMRSDLDFQVDSARDEASASETLRKGQTRWMALGQTADGPQVAPMLGSDAQRRLRATADWWKNWASRCRLPETGRSGVLRSAIALKSVTYTPTGAVLAAPTTSLPEEIGGERNWDYRFCWIRDASFMTRALLNLGLHEESQAFLSWLMYAGRLTRPRLEVLYDVHGRRGRKEKVLDHFSGYMESRPVRVGNDARDQLQLDTYGSLLDAAWLHHRQTGGLRRAEFRMLRDLVRTARDLWQRPDRGIWEIRSGSRHHTLSKVMCWVAMDRGRQFARDGLMRLDESRLEREMAQIRATVEGGGFNETVGSYTATLGGETVDASLLLLSICGFEPPASARMNRTIDQIYRRLGEGAALYRYLEPDGLPGREGQFGICGFWGVEALARAGRIEEAREKFDSLMGHANDVGLFAEQLDAVNHRALGNFPQALTHAGVINAACAIDKALGWRGEVSTHEKAMQS